MRTYVTTVIIAGALALAGCGSDDASELSGPQADAAAVAIDEAAADGVTLDEACVNEVASQLSDEDAELAASDSEAELSAEGEETALGLLRCTDAEGLRTLFLAGLGEGGGAFDEECAREKLEAFDADELIASASSEEPPAEFVEALTECFTG